MRLDKETTRPYESGLIGGSNPPPVINTGGIKLKWVLGYERGFMQSVKREFPTYEEALAYFMKIGRPKDAYIRQEKEVTNGPLG